MTRTRTFGMSSALHCEETQSCAAARAKWILVTLAFEQHMDHRNSCSDPFSSLKFVRIVRSFYSYFWPTLPSRLPSWSWDHHLIAKLRDPDVRTSSIHPSHPSHSNTSCIHHLVFRDSSRRKTLRV